MSGVVSAAVCWLFLAMPGTVSLPVGRNEGSVCIFPLCLWQEVCLSRGVAHLPGPV